MNMRIQFKNQDNKLRLIDTGESDITKETINKALKYYNSEEGIKEIEEATNDKVCSVVLVVFEGGMSTLKVIN